MTLRPCVECGELSESTRCDEHTTSHRRGEVKASTRARGYGTPWRRLSERARKAQPFCHDCGARDDLTTDHTPEAWERYEAGLPVRLMDVAVVCRSCNGRRGAARPSAGRTETRGVTPAVGGIDPMGESKYLTHTVSSQLSARYVYLGVAMWEVGCAVLAIRSGVSR